MPNNEFGDFQTPLPLARRCLEVLGVSAHSRILEPTCGQGTFLQAAAEIAPESERLGLEVQEEYLEEARQWGTVQRANIFETNLARDLHWDSDGELLVVGNPPWVTAAELNRLDSKNLPAKENFKGAKGMEALLGGSNFDVCEFIILKALRELSYQPFRLGMLCKTQVARNLIQYAHKEGLPVAGSELFRIDALKWFDAGVDACWLVIAMDSALPPDYTTTVHDGLFAADPGAVTRFGMVNNVMVSNVDLYEDVRGADGRCPFVWRSGLKHDASSVFELEVGPEPTAKDGTPVQIEDGYIYPLLKSTAIFRGRHRELSKWVVVPQKSFGAETSHLEREAPGLWTYLTAYGEALDGRKSSIYRNRPRFSVFGHGEYTYAPYKVAISGLHKAPAFRLVAPIEGLPVVLDDTCYFLPFDDPSEASVITALLASDAATALIESLVFWDSKRPITKKLLSRLNLGRLPVESEEIFRSAQDIAAEAEVAFDCTAAGEYLDTLHNKEDLVLF